MTILEIINRVLRRLREDTVTSLSENDYSLMLTDMLSDVHDECMKHDWSSMEHLVNVSVSASERVLDLSRIVADGGDVGNSDRVPTTSSFVLYDHDQRPMAWIMDDAADPEGERMIFASEAEIERLYQMDRNETNDNPVYFSLRNHPDRDGLEMTLWPAPATSRHIHVKFWTPESPIDSATDTNRTLLVPSRPLTTGLLFLALNERGEEMGEPGGVAESRYLKSLDEAVEADQNRRGLANRFIAQRV